MTFANPIALLLILLLPLLLLGMLKRNGFRPVVTFSSVDILARSGRSLRQNLSWLPLLLRIFCLTLLITALARPQAGMEKIHDVNRGIAIEMVVDRSGSMGREMEYKGRTTTRLAVVKQLFADFVVGNKKNLAGRPNDLIGMIAFARYADTVCPLTLAHGALSQFLDNIKLVDRRDEDGTAIGDAIALAAARLQKAEETLAQQTKNKDKRYTIKSKIIILLTDGENNMGKKVPAEAAELAKKWGIKIYAIGVGGEDVVELQTFFGTRKFKTGRGIDKATLQHITDVTDGKFWLAEDAEALQTAYEEIDSLEKSEVESIRYIDYKENFPRFALPALILLILEMILTATIFRRTP